ncbi:2-dehydro-3-deoxygluconokinase [Shimia sp. SK013]|uniref:sugar kinase n=1 Tax=Shimia sp. SK013 TaxID=1389006 RepID=UPI0006B4EFF0|nr:sugar kinase [Shimia sp. SK013]KPA21610.1 2-dehydro-3-deoxygluconokinase [Shimia sp. SK013]
MRNKLLAIGECMVEMAPTESGLFKMGYAGDTFNTAWYARGLADPNLDIAFMTAVGDDAASDRLVDFVTQSGITPEIRRIADASVGLYLIATQNGERSFSYWRSAAAARQLAQDLTDLPVSGAGDIVFFSGITMAVLQGHGRQKLLAAVARAKAKGAQVAFDPNLRPCLWEDADTMRHWVTEAARHADLVLPSHEDEASWFSDASPTATARRYLDLGCDLAIVKDGPGPVQIAHATGETQTVAPHPIATLVDTTAAGDAFNAAVLVALMSGKSESVAVQAGCDLSAQVIQEPGALVEV